MSAEILGKAAAKMRELAEAATEGPWVADGLEHPAVALAVADWLEAEARAAEFAGGPDLFSGHALAVARAYLGEGGDE